MPFHVQVGGRGLSMRSGTRYNLEAEAVRQLFVQPWNEGLPFVVSGSVFEPSDCRIQVRKGPKLSSAVINSMTAWMTAMESSVDVTDDFITAAPGSSRAPVGEGEPDLDPRRVAVIHGRDALAKDALFDLLRALDLRPLEWTELVRATGSGAPANRTIVEQLFVLAAAAVVLLSPDDEARLHPELAVAADTRGEGAWACQPRPNVLLEAGMALAHRPSRTIFVEVGAVRLPTDLDGVNVVRLDGTAPPLHELASRLRGAGCAVDTQSGSAWLETGRWASLDARGRLPSA